MTYYLKWPDDVLDRGKLHIHVRKSKFQLPAASNHPIVMIASGTVIAPFRRLMYRLCRWILGLTHTFADLQGWRETLRRGLYGCLKDERRWNEDVSSAWLKQQKLITRWQEDV